jgi:hypothetical protein
VYLTITTWKKNVSISRYQYRFDCESAIDNFRFVNNRSVNAHTQYNTLLGQCVLEDMLFSPRLKQTCTFLQHNSNTLTATFKYINEAHKLVHGSTSSKNMSYLCSIVFAHTHTNLRTRLCTCIHICDCFHTFVDIHVYIQTRTLTLSFRYQVRDGALLFCY